MAGPIARTSTGLAVIDQTGVASLVSGTTLEGVTSIATVPGKADVEVVHIDVDVDTTTAFMIVDLSDTTNWPHTKTGHLDIAHFLINIDPATNFAGDIELGFLTDVNATNGDFHGIMEFHLDKKTEPFTFGLNFGAFGMDLELDHWFGPTTSNSTLFQTDVNLAGPDGNASFPSGAGDLVMIVTVSATTVAVGLTIGYFAED